MRGKPIDSIVDKLVTGEIGFDEAVDLINKYIHSGKFSNVELAKMIRRKDTRPTIGHFFIDIAMGIRKETASMNVFKCLMKSNGYDVNIEIFGTDAIGKAFVENEDRGKPDYLLSINVSPFCPIDWKNCATDSKSKINTFKQTDIANYKKRNAGMIVCVGPKRMKELSVADYQKECSRLMLNIGNKTITNDSVIQRFIVYGSKAVHYLSQFEAKVYPRINGNRPSIQVAEYAPELCFDKMREQGVIDAIEINDFAIDCKGPIKNMANIGLY